MPVELRGSERPGRRGALRGPQSFVAGVILVVFAAYAIWLTRDLSQGTLGSMGPAMLPRWLAIGVGLCGLALIGIGVVREGDPLERWHIRGPGLVLVAILGFALTIRPFAFGSVSSPGLGLVVAGPLAILIGGYASEEARLRELVILALSLTPFCMVLFGDLLNLPIPIFPQAFADLFPSDWSQKQILRATALAMILVGLAVFLATRRRGRSAPVDVANHSGRI